MEKAIRPEQDKGKTLETYNASSVELARYFDGIGVRMEDIRTGFRLVDKKNPSVIEVGCGSGRDATGILMWTNDYIGFDLSEGMLKLAKQANPEGSFEIGDLATYKFPEQTDLIFSFASILHSDSDEVGAFLEHAEASLNQRGIIYISTKAGEYTREVKTDEFGTRTFYYYDVPHLLSLAPRSLEPAFEDYQRIGRTEWVTLALRKHAET